MEWEFLNCFYSTCCIANMIKLTNTKQWKNEPVVDYISRWCSLSLNYKDRFSDISSIEICVQGLHWGLHYLIYGTKLHTFEELAICAYDVELSITQHGKKDSVVDYRKDKVCG